ncbi:methylmalonyl-CoA mutase family protein [Thermodesulfobacteriota bacterium]
MSQSKAKRIRVLLASPGLDGHDVGPRLFAAALMDAGIEVIFLGVKQSIPAIVRAAEQEDPDVIGLSVFSGIHLDAINELIPELKKAGRGDIPLLVGGTIPPPDIPALIEAGAANAWVPGTNPDQIIGFIKRLVHGEAAIEPKDSEEPEVPPEKPWQTEDAKIPLNIYYTSDDLADLDLAEDLGTPGTFPYTRGIYESPYRSYMWQVRQYTGLGLPEQTNERARYIVEQGGTGRGGVAVLNIIYDQPTQHGYDSDAPEASFDVARVGTAVDSIEDMEIIFKDLDLERIFYNFPSYFMANAFWAMYVGLARRRGLPQERLMGATINAPFESFVCTGSRLFHPLHALRLGLDLMGYAAKTSRRFSAITLSANNIRESGAYNYQSVAWALAEGIAYSQGMIRRGMDIDSFAPIFSFYCSTERDFFEEIAKYRALRRIWAQEVQRRFTPKKPRSMTARITCRTVGSMLTAQQPLINIARTTTQALSSLLGGVQSVTITPYDEVLSIPSKESMTMSLRQHDILGYETNVRAVSDPLGGSYFIEKLTSQYEEKVREEMEKIERRGADEEYGVAMLSGFIKGIESGYFRNVISEASASRQREIQKGDLLIVGVNRSVEEEEVPVRIEPGDPKSKAIKIERLKKFKENRDMKAVDRALEKLREAAQGSENVMEPMIEAFMAGATVQEVYRGTLLEAFGPWEKESSIPVFRQPR